MNRKQFEAIRGKIESIIVGMPIVDTLIVLLSISSSTAAMILKMSRSEFLEMAGEFYDTRNPDTVRHHMERFADGRGHDRHLRQHFRVQPLHVDIHEIEISSPEMICVELDPSDNNRASEMLQLWGYTCTLIGGNILAVRG